MEPSTEFDGGGDGESGGGGSCDDKSKKIGDQKPGEGGGAAAGGIKGKSCKGYLYYSSVLKSNGNNPRCIGIPRTLPSGTNFDVGPSEHPSSKEKDLNNFYYGCAGYSVYVNGDHLVDREESKTRLPVCIGLELLVNKKAMTSSTSAPAPATAPAHHREDGRSDSPRPPLPKPMQPPTDDFLTRFTRNANLVASGVARNMRRVGNHIKDTVDDILFPFRRRPK